MPYLFVLWQGTLVCGIARGHSNISARAQRFRLNPILLPASSAKLPPSPSTHLWIYMLKENSSFKVQRKDHLSMHMEKDSYETDLVSLEEKLPLVCHWPFPSGWKDHPSHMHLRGILALCISVDKLPVLCTFYGVFLSVVVWIIMVDFFDIWIHL